MPQKLSYHLWSIMGAWIIWAFIYLLEHHSFRICLLLVESRLMFTSSDTRGELGRLRVAERRQGEHSSDFQVFGKPKFPWVLVTSHSWSIHWGNLQEPLSMKDESEGRKLLSLEVSGPLPFRGPVWCLGCPLRRVSRAPSQYSMPCWESFSPSEGRQTDSSPTSPALPGVSSSSVISLLAIPLTCLISSSCRDQKLCFY